ncbi:MAG: DEAD/DEAH box helicase [Acidobacteriales bacterium]|nr:DEAD/DEAH box helicase [Terriglobales bacterium]
MQGSLFSGPRQALSLRHYQQSAVNAVYNHLRKRDDNPCVVIPTGGGKTPVIATICSDTVKRWNGRAIVLAHVKELLEQSADKLASVCPDVPIGIHSAGLGRRDKAQPVIVAGIQSVYNKACELGPFDLALIDEAHLIQPDGEGMYSTFLAEAKIVNPQLRCVGFTATPFRLSSGPICTPDGILNSICYEIGVRQLIVEGYLSPLVSKNGKHKADTSGLHIRGGEFVAEEVSALMGDDILVRDAVDEIIAYTADRKSVLIFAADVAHASQVCNAFNDRGQTCHVITGETPAAARAAMLAAFRDQEFKYLVNVQVLTTGFDAPNVDCIPLLRPTNSPGLYYQMVGRGFRICEGKLDCLILDYGGNVDRHGPVDLVSIFDIAEGKTGQAPTKECPQCQSVIFAGYATCPHCSYEFPPPDRQRHSGEATDEDILSGSVTDTPYDVLETEYSVWTKASNPSGPKSMRVGYRVAYTDWQYEWICFEHSGYAYEKACGWWRDRSPDPLPKTAQDAVNACRLGAVADTHAILVRSVSGEKFDSIIAYKLGDKPPPLETPEIEDVPF